MLVIIIAVTVTGFHPNLKGKTLEYELHVFVVA